MYLCAARFRQDDVSDVTVSEWAPTRGMAFLDVVAKMPVGFRPSQHNMDGALALLDELNDKPMDVGEPQRRHEWAYLTRQSETMFTIQIGWVDYVIRSTPDAWAVVCHVTSVSDEGWSRTREVPTFYLDPRVQGCITAEAARRVATEIVRPFPDYHNYEVHVAVEPIWH